MSFTESRELTLTDPDGGSSITLSRNGSTVRIESADFRINHEGKSALELGTADRLALINFLNMGEFRELSQTERR